MQALLVRRPGIGKGRASRESRARGFAFGTYLLAATLAWPAGAQTRIGRASLVHEQSARRARTVRADRTEWREEPQRDYAEDVDAAYLGTPADDTGALEKRIRDLVFEGPRAQRPFGATAGDCVSASCSVAPSAFYAARAGSPASTAQNLRRGAPRADSGTSPSHPRGIERPGKAKAAGDRPRTCRSRSPTRAGA